MDTIINVGITIGFASYMTYFFYTTNIPYKKTIGFIIVAFLTIVYHLTF